jgi:radical SAM protein with 4Fe4S-binding SPASM domain
MVEAGVEFNFSLEGATKESYEAVRGHRFEKFFNVIEETCREKNMRRDSGSQVSLGFTVFRDNIRETTEIIRKAAQIGVDRVIVTHFIPWEESQRNQSLAYHKGLSNAGELGITVYLPSPFKTDGGGTTAPQDSFPKKKCFHPWKSVSINENGDVMPCCASSVVMGNLGRSSFSEIWNGARYRKLRNTVNSSRPLVFCRNCAFRQIDAGSGKRVSFWSDEEILLGAIGTGERRKSSFMLLRNIKGELRKTRLGRRLLPYLINLYRNHGAFYVSDIHDIWLNYLAGKLSGGGGHKSRFRLF